MTDTRTKETPCPHCSGTGYEIFDWRHDEHHRFAEWLDDQRATDETVAAQHDETGRMWTGPRSQLPPRYNIVTAADKSVETSARTSHSLLFPDGAVPFRVQILLYTRALVEDEKGFAALLARDVREHLLRGEAIAIKLATADKS